MFMKRKTFFRCSYIIYRHLFARQGKGMFEWMETWWRRDFGRFVFSARNLADWNCWLVISGRFPRDNWRQHKFQLQNSTSHNRIHVFTTFGCTNNNCRSKSNPLVLTFQHQLLGGLFDPLSAFRLMFRSVSDVISGFHPTTFRVASSKLKIYSEKANVCTIETHIFRAIFSLPICYEE